MAMSLRPQYHYRQSDAGLLVWNVSRLIHLAAELPIVLWPLNSINEYDEAYWYDLGQAQPTCRQLVEHMTLVMQADLTYPILLDTTGRIMDGMHRVCRAHLDGQTHIRAQQFQQAVVPDFTNVSIDDLPEPEVLPMHR